LVRDVSAWLLVLGVRARRSGTSQVESVGLSWTIPLEPVPIDRSPFWLVIFGVRACRSGTSQVESVGLSWTIPLETVPIDRSPFWLVILSPGVIRVRPEYREDESWRLLHDNASSHRSTLLTDYLIKNHNLTINHFPIHIIWHRVTSSFLEKCIYP